MTSKGSLVGRIAAMRKDLSETELDVLQELRRRPGSDQFDIALAINQYVSMVAGALGTLIQHGLIDIVCGRQGIWTAYALNVRDVGGIQGRRRTPTQGPMPTGEREPTDTGIFEPAAPRRIR